MNRFPRVSTLFGARAGILMNEIDTINASRVIIRYRPSSSFLDCVSLLVDAFVRAAAGLLARGGRRAVEPGNRAPLRVVLHGGSATPRDVRAGAVPVWLVFGRALRSCAALFMMVNFGATSLVAAAALRLLVEGFAAALAKLGRVEYLPSSMLDETPGLAAAPVETSVGNRWRVTDDPMRHVFRMAAWNALGWPELPAPGLRGRPTLSPSTEERASFEWATWRSPCGVSGRLVDLSVGACWASRGRFCLTLERVEEETTYALEAADELPDETLARGGATVLLEVPWTYVDARFPTLLPRCARRSSTRPSNYRTALGCWKSKMPRAPRMPLSLLRTSMTSVRRDGLRVVTYRVEGHVRRARYEIWSPTSCGPCRCGGAQGTSRCLEPMPVSCSTGSDAREL